MQDIELYKRMRGITAPWVASDWLKETSISGVAELLGLSWEEAAGIQERAVNRGLARRKKQPLEHIGVDETSFQKRHEYVTVILGRHRDVVLEVLDDRKAVGLFVRASSCPRFPGR